jgi:signal transduction histidine kinase
MASKKRANAPFVRVSVTDTGCGIAPDNVQKNFTPYFTTKPQGAGLGLAVVGELANKYNGAIQIISAVNQGATFNVFLPLAA